VGDELPVLIAGAGIGGLTLACALQRRGIACRVFEKAKELRPIGAGITMQGNAMLALRAIGLEDAVRAAGEAPSRIEIRRADGALLVGMDLAPIERAVGATTIAIHRGELHGVLHAHAGDVITLGAEATGYRDGGDAITLVLAGGREVRGRVLIGADGLHSAIRSQVLGDTPLRYAGYTSWRGVTAAGVVAKLPPAMVGGEAMGRGERFGWIPVGRGRLYWFAVANAPAGERDDDHAGAVRARFASWGVPVGTLLDHTPAGEILRTDIHDRAPVATWGAGRVTLLGDAVHPMTPNLGQGGAQAVEDAVVLASALAAMPADPIAALRRYEAARVARANRIVRAARRLGTMFQTDGAVSSRVRDAVFKLGGPGAATTRAIKMMRDGLVLDVTAPAS
jgi:2-polyprenyl-6-methoxyphenol hydroxylase-like FAD-dependent oxidoreductase